MNWFKCCNFFFILGIEKSLKWFLQCNPGGHQVYAFSISITFFILIYGSWMALSPYFPIIYISIYIYIILFYILYFILYIYIFFPFSLWMLNDISCICNWWPCPSPFFIFKKRFKFIFFLSISNDHKCVDVNRAPTKLRS